MSNNICYQLSATSVQEGVRQPLNLKKEVCIMTVTLLRKWRDVEINSLFAWAEIWLVFCERKTLLNGWMI
jgi:hypothetical protein